MTAQIPDYYKFDGEEYNLVASTEKIGFNPKEYGIKPTARCTACWRGYWCGFDILNNMLVLSELYIFNEDDIYPDINGISVSPPEYYEANVMKFKNGKPVHSKELMRKYMGHRKYENLNLLIDFDGKILMGKDFLREYYIHMGIQPGYAYKKLIELEFKNGVLIGKKDLSKKAKAVRVSIDSRKKEHCVMDRKDIEEFVRLSFSDTYEDKAWFL